MTKHDFWKSSGFHLLEKADNGWLNVTPDFLRAYFTRPEIHPIDTSCDAEHRVFEKLMADPFVLISPVELDAIVDHDAADNYRILLRFRDSLKEGKTLENTYLNLMKSGTINIPPLFIDQMVHIIVRNILDSSDDPIRIKSAELFFREQNVSTQDGQLMLADQEIVEMYAKTGGAGGLGQLLQDSETPMKSVELDILDDDNADIYWERSERFDMVIDFRFTKPALDAFARMIESWIHHFHGLKVNVQPRRNIADEKWSWHIGLDRESTDLLNSLYKGDEPSAEASDRLVALFSMTILDSSRVIDTLREKPVYLGLAMDSSNVVKMKPQNLLLNLPLVAST